MNVNFSLGLLSFIVWSTFSTWYYVNYIKHFDEEPLAIEAITPNIGESKDEKTVIEAIEKQEEVQPINLSRNLFFVKNTTSLIAPDEFDSFYDSLQRATRGQIIQVSVIGYACDLGAEAYNMSLSKDRAEVIANLIEGGPFEVASVSYKGESEPLLPNTTESNRAKNRRVNLQFITK
ncbi:MAG: OmpA family protein [Bacteroidota bacterium]